MTKTLAIAVTLLALTIPAQALDDMGDAGMRVYAEKCRALPPGIKPSHDITETYSTAKQLLDEHPEFTDDFCTRVRPYVQALAVLAGLADSLPWLALALALMINRKIRRLATRIINPRGHLATFCNQINSRATPAA